MSADLMQEMLRAESLPVLNGKYEPLVCEVWLVIR